jgi:acetyl esterase/lipase
MQVYLLSMVAVLVVLGMAATAAEPGGEQLLWPNGAPGATGNTPKDQPSITVHLAPAEKANGTSVVICPGGGYGALMMTYEGHDIAKWLNEQGVAGIVLKYRIAPYKHPAPMLDVQRAIRTVRAHAAEWKLDPQKIGVMGFSAGGHVAATASTHIDAGNASAADPIDKQGCRPNFSILVYPVVSMGPKSHGGSRGNLLGPKPAPELIELLSNEKQVTKETPPAFLVHSTTDKIVTWENSQLYADACKAQGVPVEFLKLTQGDHGLGCGKGEQWAQWQTGCLEWMRGLKLIGK